MFGTRIHNALRIDFRIWRFKKRQGGKHRFVPPTASEMPRTKNTTRKEKTPPPSPKKKRAPPRKRSTPPIKKVRVAVPAQRAGLGQESDQEEEELGDDDAAGSGSDTHSDKKSDAAQGGASSSSSSSDNDDDGEDGSFKDDPPEVENDVESDEDDEPRREPVTKSRVHPSARVQQTARIQTGTNRQRKGPPSSTYQNRQHVHQSPAPAAPRPSANITGVTGSLDIKQYLGDIMGQIRQLNTSVIAVKSDIKKNHNEVDARLDKIKIQADSNDRRLNTLTSGSIARPPHLSHDIPVPSDFALYWDKDRKASGTSYFFSFIYLFSSSTDRVLLPQPLNASSPSSPTTSSLKSPSRRRPSPPSSARLPCRCTGRPSRRTAPSRSGPSDGLGRTPSAG